jgi:hypothetical protein
MYSFICSIVVAGGGGCPNAYPTGPHTCLAARSRSDLQKLCHAEYTTALWMTQLKANNGPSTVTSLGGGDVWRYIDPTPANVPPSKPGEVKLRIGPKKCNLFECYTTTKRFLEAHATTLNATRKTDATPQLVAHGAFVYVSPHQLSVLCCACQVRRQVHHRFRR